jgi:hypothetical protein
LGTIAIACRGVRTLLEATALFKFKAVTFRNFGGFNRLDYRGAVWLLAISDIFGIFGRIF